MNIDPATWTADERAAFMARRASRNRAIGILLFAMVALFFGITVVRMSGQVSAPTTAAAS
ncbi:hypothetical protein [Sandarakinorhabdus limnophila]|jgi:hypothetical protein|uniref:hypothetical protein n=1 Tax=Sandarakinorhabdus limnophila TaxID=210512 RepID=UPI0026EDD279|nr:hypothetical protein [Sandarakinorhabdus limnophila]MCM0032851.1 hypothetical protein [Sandarakinorhabdus limnophila]